MEFNCFKEYNNYKKILSTSSIKRNLPISVYWEECYKSSGFWFILSFFILIVLFALLFQIWILLSIIFIFYLILTELQLEKLFILKFGRIIKAKVVSIHFFEGTLSFEDETDKNIEMSYDILIEFENNGELIRRIANVKYSGPYFGEGSLIILFLEQTDEIILYPELSNNQQNIFLEEIKSLDL